ncbi:MAG TPA: cation-translocating P-type ATPase, partial [Pyrinomonadaceae bacterium]|nr:cation-translocating P-type ATPase [Pyrinomonadaceae bacterium]
MNADRKNSAEEIKNSQVISETGIPVCSVECEILRGKETAGKSNINTNQLPLHSISAARVAEIFNVEISKGLSEEEADQRLDAYGSNRLELRQRQKWWHLLLAQFSSIIVWLLAFAAVFSWLNDNQLESFAILVVLALNASIGFFIEWQAGRALDALKKATRTTTRVRRQGREQIIDAENLVAGDVVIFTAGDKVSADARIFESATLLADESTLTGESTAVEKNSAAVETSAPLAERCSMLYLGTNVVAGHAAAIVTATGQNTEIGRIGKMVAQAGEEKTPLEKKLADLGKRLVYIVLGIALIIFVVGIFRGEGLWLMLEVSISLAVAAVPEGLPAVTTLILALGVLRMARQNAIIRRLAAVETLGSTTVICTDKTGTLTENRMTVCEYRLANDRVIKIFENGGYDSVGETRTFVQDQSLLRLLRVSVFCNEATLDSKNGGSCQPIGDPTETALLTAVEKFGFDISSERSACEKVLEHPFDSATKRMIAILREKDEAKTCAVLKGAPAVVLDLCDKYVSNEGIQIPLTEEKRRDFLKINEEMADCALRVLAFADKDLSGESEFPTGKELEKDYTFLGFVGMSDPPRKGVAEAVKEAQSAGIRVVMLTGDQIKTAQAIARELNLSQTDEVFALHSGDLAEKDGEILASMARRAHVFARVTPEDKMRIVKALRQTGEIVAVTGDGVNDAPALKYADIGIAMGLRGTEVAKEASDIILTDDNFRTIVKAVEGGRTIYANIIKFVHLLFSDNLGEVLVIFVAVLAGFPLPLLPLQILWVNLVTDVFPALALALEPASPETMRRKPHPPDEALLSAKFLLLIFWKAVISSSIVIGAYSWALQTYGEGAHARTIALFTLIGVQLGNLFNCRSRSRSA